MTKRNTILVVDDQANVRNILEYNLKRRGFDILSAQDGLAAITLATNHTPDVILLDIMMPGIDGFQVLEKLRTGERTATIPILIVSAKGTEEDILKALKLGARDYIVKPFNLEQLMQKVFRMLQGAAEAAATEAAAKEQAVEVKASWPAVAVLKLGKTYPENDEELGRQIVRLAESGVQSILLDLTKIGPVPTIAFGKLARSQQSAKKAGATIKLITGNPEHRRTLTESNFLKHFDLIESWEDAAKEIGS